MLVLLSQVDDDRPLLRDKQHIDPDKVMEDPPCGWPGMARRQAQAARRGHASRTKSRSVPYHRSIHVREKVFSRGPRFIPD